MSALPDLTKLSVGQFAERFRTEMIPLSTTFSYFCASVPLSEEDLKEYLEEPIASLPPLFPRFCRKSRSCWFRTWSVSTGKTGSSEAGVCLHRKAAGEPAVLGLAGAPGGRRGPVICS